MPAYSKIDESKVQGDGGYLIVMERIASAQEDIHVQVLALPFVINLW